MTFPSHHGPTTGGNGHGEHDEEPTSQAATTYPARASQPTSQPPPRAMRESAGFLPQGTDQEVRRRLERMQAGFIDDPAGAVAEAGHLANRLLATVRDCLDRERAAVELAAQSARGSTEELRVCLQRYRALIDRLLAIGC